MLSLRERSGSNCPACRSFCTGSFYPAV